KEIVIPMKIAQNVITIAVHRGAYAPSRALCRALTAKRMQRIVGSRPQSRQSSRWRGRHRMHARTRALPSAFAALVVLTTSAFAQYADNIAQREVQRRQVAIPQGEAALARGQAALRSKNYTVAYQEFKTAIAYLPDSVVSGKAHDEAADGVCKSGTV